MTDALIQMVFDVLKTLAVTAIGVCGAWLTAKIAQNQKLVGIANATEQVVQAAQITVGELNQTVVDDIKKNGLKLTDEEIADLKSRLLTQALKKISFPTISLLEAASVDVQALISGAGEDWIDRIKSCK